MKIIGRKIIGLILGMSGRPINCLNLTQKIDSTYSHGLKLINILKEKKVIKQIYSKNKTERLFVLTDKGKKIKLLLLEIRGLEDKK